MLAVNRLFALHRSLSGDEGEPRRGQSLARVLSQKRPVPGEDRRAPVYPGVELGPGLHSRPGARWGERLSDGATRALAAALRRHLASDVTTDPALAPPGSARLLVDLWAFECDVQAGACLMQGRWLFRGEASAGTGPDGEVAGGLLLRAPLAGPTDGAVAATMGRLVGEAARGMAAGLAAARRR